jgi:outer membrane protein OmpA-like peptidoglycan-associated protein
MQANFKSKLLMGTAAVALIAVAGGQKAGAQSVIGGQAPGTVSISVEGGYAIGVSSTNSTAWAEYSDHVDPPLFVDSGNGFIARAAVGWQYDPTWSFGIMYTGLRSSQSSNGRGTDYMNTVMGGGGTSPAYAYNATGTVSTKIRADLVDFQAGYDFNLGFMNGVGTALFGGEFGHIVQKTDVSILGYYDGPTNIGSVRESTFTGAGPTIGFKGQIPLTGDIHQGFGITGEGMGGVLVGHLDSQSYGYNDYGTYYNRYIAKTQIAGTVQGQLALTYTAPVGAASTLQIALGYQILYLDGVRDSANGGSYEGASYGSQKDSLLYHGPFARLTYNWGVPAAPPPPPPAAAPAAAPVPPPHQEHKFIVFFDFDKSTLTPDGKKIVETTAATFKATGAAHLDLTGYTDLSGTQAYNLKLSERRAETVRNYLVQLGVPASDIGVYWRGKENPRVPTPDGVREPQNRRVEIIMP